MSGLKKSDPGNAAQLLRLAVLCAGVAIGFAILKTALAPNAISAGVAVALAAVAFVLGADAEDTPDERLAQVKSMIWLIPLSVPFGVTVGLIAAGPFHLDEIGRWIDGLEKYGPQSAMLMASLIAGLALGHRRAISARRA